MVCSAHQLSAARVHQHAAGHRLPLSRPGGHPRGSARGQQGHLPWGAALCRRGEGQGWMSGMERYSSKKGRLHEGLEVIRECKRATAKRLLEEELGEAMSCRGFVNVKHLKSILYN